MEGGEDRRGSMLFVGGLYRPVDKVIFEFKICWFQIRAAGLRTEHIQ